MEPLKEHNTNDQREDSLEAARPSSLNSFCASCPTWPTCPGPPPPPPKSSCPPSCPTSPSVRSLRCSSATSCRPPRPRSFAVSSPLSSSSSRQVPPQSACRPSSPSSHGRRASQRNCTAPHRSPPQFWREPEQAAPAWPSAGPGRQHLSLAKVAVIVQNLFAFLLALLLVMLLQLPLQLLLFLHRFLQLPDLLLLNGNPAPLLLPQHLLIDLLLGELLLLHPGVHRAQPRAQRLLHPLLHVGGNHLKVFWGAGVRLRRQASRASDNNPAPTKPDVIFNILLFFWVAGSFQVVSAEFLLPLLRRWG